MIPLAILKDSIREAWDSKILLVLLILSTLFALLLASIGYDPVPAEETFERARMDFPRIRVDKGRFELPPSGMGEPRVDVRYAVKDFTEITPAANPANGEYAFTLTATPGDPPPKRGPDGQPLPVPPKKEGEPKKEPELDTFQQSVILWHIGSDDFYKLLRNRGNFGEADLEKLLNFTLTPATMEDFIKERYEYHYNMKVKAVQRTAGPLKGPQEFRVTTGTSDPRTWPHTSSMFFGSVSLKKVIPPTSLGQIVYVIQNYLVNGVGAGIAVMLGIIVTSFFLPTMLRKGSIDLMLAKPISRPALLIYKYLGGLSFMFIFAAVSVGSVWVVFGLTSGLWNPKFLLLIPLLTYAFGILYALSTLVSVWTRSAVASLLVTMAASGLLWLLAFVYNKIDEFRNTPLKDEAPAWLYPTADIVNAVLPRTRDLDVMTTKLIADVMTPNDQLKWEIDKLTTPGWAGSLGGSLAWITGMLGLACWRFSRKDY